MRKIFKGMKLDIGAGNPAEGENQATNDYFLQDAEAHEGIDIVCDIRTLKYELIRLAHKELGEGIPNICSEIRASHVLEHFHMNELKKDILPMLRECLTDDGILNIIVPNFEWHCELVKQGHDENAVHMAFGGGLDKYDHHYTGWTERNAYRWLFDAGFEVIDLHTDTCVHIKAKKQ
jgi:hypothetical protein